MQRRHSINWSTIFLIAAQCSVYLLLIYLILVLLSCATVEAIASAPEEFYVTLDLILAALIDDVMAFIDLLL